MMKLLALHIPGLVGLTVLLLCGISFAVSDFVGPESFSRSTENPPATDSNSFLQTWQYIPQYDFEVNVTFPASDMIITMNAYEELWIRINIAFTAHGGVNGSLHDTTVLENLELCKELDGFKECGPLAFHRSFTPYPMAQSFTYTKEVEVKVHDGHSVLAPRTMRKVQVSIVYGQSIVAKSTPVTYETRAIKKNPWWTSFEDPSLHLNMGKAERCSQEVPAEVSPALETSSRYEGLPHLLGPNIGPKEARKSLFVIFAGKKLQENVDAIVNKFPLEQFHLLLFVYDDSQWVGRFDWAVHPSVTILYKHKQMKWWYMKHWVTPQVASSYDFILVIDEDCDVTLFDPVVFVGSMRKHRVREWGALSMERGNIPSSSTSTNTITSSNCNYYCHH